MTNNYDFVATMTHEEFRNWYKALNREEKNHYNDFVTKSFYKDKKIILCYRNIGDKIEICDPSHEMNLHHCFARVKPEAEA